jgi:hypothetical protein
MSNNQLPDTSRSLKIQSEPELVLFSLSRFLFRSTHLTLRPDLAAITRAGLAGGGAQTNGGPG